MTSHQASDGFASSDGPASSDGLASSDGFASPGPVTRLEAWGEMERHFQEQDRRIAAWLAPRGSRRLNVASVARLRETHFSWWARLEHRAVTEVRPPTGRDPAAREYLSGYVRPSERRASLMERACPTRLIWSVLWAASVWFFAPALLPRQVEALIDFLKAWI